MIMVCISRSGGKRCDSDGKKRLQSSGCDPLFCRNEIPEIGTDKGAQTCQQLSDKIHELDDTRFTLASINGVLQRGSVDQIVADVVADLMQKERLMEMSTTS